MADQFLRSPGAHQTRTTTERAASNARLQSMCTTDDDILGHGATGWPLVIMCSSTLSYLNTGHRQQRRLASMFCAQFARCESPYATRRTTPDPRKFAYHITRSVRANANYSNPRTRHRDGNVRRKLVIKRVPAAHTHTKLKYAHTAVVCVAVVCGCFYSIACAVYVLRAIPTHANKNSSSSSLSLLA